MNPFNPEAGDTPSPAEPLAIAVAQRAAALVWRAVPYFALRYGERGRRFGLSDGGWIITLASLAEDARRAQVEWLIGLLALRGMPSSLVELQLVASCRIGTRLGWNGAAALGSTATHLATRRRTTLTDATFAEADRIFCAEAGEHVRTARGTGRLIAAAQVDIVLERCTSTAPLMSWLADPTRFEPRWCMAAERTAEYVASAPRPG